LENISNIVEKAIKNSLRQYIMVYRGTIHLINVILLAFTALMASLTFLMVLMRDLRDVKTRSHLLIESKLEKVSLISREFNASCSGLLEIANNLRGTLSRIERIARFEPGRTDAESEKKKLRQEIMSAQSQVEKLRHSYTEPYLPASAKILAQADELNAIKDRDLSRLFNELVLLDERLKGTWGNLDKMDTTETAKALLGQFNRICNYIYLLYETNQRMADRANSLRNMR
jgi:hypothetical protein